MYGNLFREFPNLKVSNMLFLVADEFIPGTKGSVEAPDASSVPLPRLAAVKMAKVGARVVAELRQRFFGC